LYAELCADENRIEVLTLNEASILPAGIIGISGRYEASAMKYLQRVNCKSKDRYGPGDRHSSEHETPKMIRLELHPRPQSGDQDRVNLPKMPCRMVFMPRKSFSPGKARRSSASFIKPFGKNISL
jgi:hypothetical protein